MNKKGIRNDKQRKKKGERGREGESEVKNRKKWRLYKSGGKESGDYKRAGGERELRL